MAAVRLVVLALLVACGGRYGGTRGDEPRPARGIAAAALPYSVLDARTGRQVDKQTFWARVGSSRVVCVGEDHPNPHHHWFQLEVVNEVVRRREQGTPLGLGMEMFQRPYQGVLDDYAARRIDSAALLSRSGWEERWGYDYGLYGPTIDKARDAGAVLLALNAPREIVKKLVRQGLEAFTDDERRQVPELVLDDPQHRAWFDATMAEIGGHGDDNPHATSPPHDTHHDKSNDKANDTTAEAPAKMPSADRIYAAQVLWDETMADAAARWSAANPTGLLVVLAGNGHCHDSAIVRRVQRRGIDRVISIQPVLDVHGKVSRALASPVNDFVVVLELPPEAKANPQAAR